MMIPFSLYGMGWRKPCHHIYPLRKGEPTSASPWSTSALALPEPRQRSAERVYRQYPSAIGGRVWCFHWEPSPCVCARSFGYPHSKLLCLGYKVTNILADFQKCLFQCQRSRLMGSSFLEVRVTLTF